MRKWKDLMELAAKAAGYEVSWSDQYKGFAYDRPINIDNPPTLSGMRTTWEPDINDGDAMRLAVKLKMFTPGSALQSNFELAMAEQDEPYSAARLAILMTAANLFLREENSVETNT